MHAKVLDYGVKRYKANTGYNHPFATRNISEKYLRQVFTCKPQQPTKHFHGRYHDEMLGWVGDATSGHARGNLAGGCDGKVSFQGDL